MLTTTKNMTADYIRVMYFQTIASGIRLVESKQNGKQDIPLRRQSWHEFLDRLIKEKHLTEAQANRIVSPEWINGNEKILQTMRS